MNVKMKQIFNLLDIIIIEKVKFLYMKVENQNIMKEKNSAHLMVED